jgi:putative thioredoxin
MNNLANIIDVTSETFQAQVVERSMTTAVLVDYWADWCGPCQMQMPILKKLVEEYAGKFVLAKVNTDEQRELAKDHGIRSLPTMRVYKNGEMAEEILAAQSESTLRILLDRYIDRESDSIRTKAMQRYEEGKHDEAIALLDEAHRTEPDNHQVTLDYAELFLKQGRSGDAEQLLAGLPRDVRDESDARRLLALLDFTLTTRNAPPRGELENTVQHNPDDMESYYQLGACYVLDGQLENAMGAFMYILQRDREFRDDAGRRALLSVFELLGNEGELVNSYRRKLFTALH